MLRGLLLTLVLLAQGGAGAQPVSDVGPNAQGRLERMAREVEPTLHGDPRRLDQYVEFFRSRLANDRRLFAFRVEASLDAGGAPQLSGFVEFAETRNGLEAFLHTLGFSNLTNRIELLPDPSLGDRAFGFVKTTQALSYDRPEEPHEIVTECLLGEPLYVLREAGDYLLVHSGEGYLGYVAADRVHRVTAADFDRYPTRSSVRMTADYLSAGGLLLPVGAVLKMVSGPDDNLRCLPTGAVVDVPPEKCVVTSFPTEAIDAAIANGRRLLGVEYLWGGKTSAGIDCSGLVQLALGTAGVSLPRDSNQQVYAGRLTATRWHRSGLRRGDTLYFLGPAGRIRHTALYLGDDRFLQAEEPRVVVSSFNPEHPNYAPNRDASFAFGKRPW